MAAQNSFLINTWNHGTNPIGATDHFKYIRNGLSLAGVGVSVTTSLVQSANTVNIFVEHFSLEIAEQLAKAQKESGLRLVLVASELLTGDSFNNVGSDQSDTTYSDLSYWRERYDAFTMLAEGADAIWLMSEYQRPGYEKNFPNKRIVTLPMCFDPIEAAISETYRAPKLYQAVFLGSHTTIREELLGELNKHIQVYTPKDVPEFAVSSLLKSAQVSLHLHLKIGWPFTSMMRHHVLLSNGAYVISEESELPGELDNFVEIVPRDSFVDIVKTRLLDDTITAKAKEMQQQYAAKGDLGQEFRAVVEATY
jgi:hypothetical protein